MSSLNQYFKVDVYSHFFKITRIDPRGRVAIENFAREFVQYGMKKEGRRWVRAPMKVFGSRTRNFSEYRFHINQYDKFLKSLDYQDVPKHTYQIETHQADSGDDVDIDVLPHWELRAHQPPVVAYLDSPEPTLIKLVEVQTGQGKTLMSLWATAKRRKRFLVSIRPMYIDKWVEDVKKVCGIERHEVAVVQGSSQLMEIIALGRHGLNEKGIKAVIISNKTLQLWYSLYEVEGAGVLDMGYDCLPDELCARLGIGTRIIDEVHQDFHLNFKVDLYTHVAKSISLSATLKADDPFLNRMYEVTYPKATRFAGLEYKRYVNTFAVLYRIHQPGKIKTTQWGSPNYSHHAFESSIIKSPAHLSSYMEMIVAIAKRFHFQEYVPGDRLLVYCASIELCTIVTDYLKVEYPKLDVRRYVEDDPYENVMEADICVSTLLSAGTGVDIAMLTTVILTTAISSTQSNVQGKGRLREIPGRQTRFAYFTCLDIPKHVQYHQKKTEILKDMAKIHQEYSYPLIVGR